MPLLPLCVQKPFNVNAVRCRPSTFGTIWISGGWTSRINFRCLPPLDLPGKTSGSIFFSPSSVRTPLWKEATLEKILRMLSVNGKLRNCTFWIIKRMAPVLLVLTWQWHFMASVLTTLRRRMQLKDPRHYMHVDGRRKTVLTVLRGMLSLMFVMHLSTMTMLLPLAQM